MIWPVYKEFLECPCVLSHERLGCYKVQIRTCEVDIDEVGTTEDETDQVRHGVVHVEVKVGGLVVQTCQRSKLRRGRDDAGETWVDVEAGEVGEAGDNPSDHLFACEVARLDGILGRVQRRS